MSTMMINSSIIHEDYARHDEGCEGLICAAWMTSWQWMRTSTPQSWGNAGEAFKREHTVAGFRRLGLAQPSNPATADELKRERQVTIDITPLSLRNPGFVSLVYHVGGDCAQRCPRHLRPRPKPSPSRPPQTVKSGSRRRCDPPVAQPQSSPSNPSPQLRSRPPISRPPATRVSLYT